MSYRQLLRRAFNGNAPIKQYESYTLAMSSVSMVIHPYKPAGTALAGRGGVGSAKPRDNQSRTRLPSSNAWWQALLSLCLVRRWLSVSQCFPVFGYLLSSPSHLSMVFSFRVLYRTSFLVRLYLHLCANFATCDRSRSGRILVLSGRVVLHCIQDWVFYWWRCVSECVDVGRMSPTSAVTECR